MEAQAQLSGAGDTGLDSCVRDGLGGPTSCVVLIDFDKVSVQSDQAQWPFDKLFKYMGIHAPPLLRWHEAWLNDRQLHFKAWINWDWQPWLEERYQHRQRDITDEMRREFLPQGSFEWPEYPGSDADNDADENGFSGWWGEGIDEDSQRA
jgi:hypothetical protein